MSDDVPRITKVVGEKPRVTSITVEWGDEYHQPIQFNGFHVGTITLTASAPAGASVARVHAWLMVQLKEMHAKQFEEKLAEWQANNRTAKR